MFVNIVNMFVNIVNMFVNIVNMFVSIVNMFVNIVNMFVNIVNMFVIIVNIRICKYFNKLCIKLFKYHSTAQLSFSHKRFSLLQHGINYGSKRVYCTSH